MTRRKSVAREDHPADIPESPASPDRYLVCLAIAEGIEKWIAEEEELPTKNDHTGALSSSDLAPLRTALHLIALAARHQSRIVAVRVTSTYVKDLFDRSKKKARSTDTFSNWNYRIGPGGTRTSQDVVVSGRVFRVVITSIAPSEERQGVRVVGVSVFEGEVNRTKGESPEVIAITEGTRRLPLITTAADVTLRNTYLLLRHQNADVAEVFARAMTRDLGVDVRAGVVWALLVPLLSLLVFFAGAPARAREAVIEFIQRTVTIEVPNNRPSIVVGDVLGEQSVAIMFTHPPFKTGDTELVFEFGDGVVFCSSNECGTPGLEKTVRVGEIGNGTARGWIVVTLLHTYPRAGTYTTVARLYRNVGAHGSHPLISVTMQRITIH